MQLAAAHGARAPYDPGIQDWWADPRDSNNNGVSNAVENLIEKLDQAYNNGWRRILLNRPAGNLIINDNLTSSQYWTIPEWKREDMEHPTLGLRAWIQAHQDPNNPENSVSVGIYVGYQLSGDVCSLWDYGNTGRIPSMSDPRDMCEIYRNNHYWARLGIAEIWFDHAGGRDRRVTGPTGATERVQSLIDLSYSPDYTGPYPVKFGAEPCYVTKPRGATWRPDRAQLPWLPWESSHQFLTSQGLDPNNLEAWPAEWQFDPREVEFGVQVEQGDLEERAFTIDTAYNYHINGFVLWVFECPDAEEYLKRILDFGVVSCPADLNVDGTVDQQDVDRVLRHIIDGVASPIPLYHGDFDRDGRLTPLDVQYIFDRFGACQ